MLFRFSVPAAVAAVELRFKEEDIGFVFPCEARQGHRGSICLFQQVVKRERVYAYMRI